MVDVRSLQIERNGASRPLWNEYEAHRRMVMRCVLSGDAGDSLLLLGAGNCNDVELRNLSKSFRRVDLCDIDADAMRQALARASLVEGDGLRCHTADLSGIADVLGEVDAARNESFDGDRIGELIDKANSAALPPDATGPCDVVASLCLLSQMIDQAVQALGHDHAQLVDVVLAIRDNHLRRMAAALKAGGVGWLITDVVSDATAPELAAVDPEDTSELMMKLLQSRNFFTGINPLVLEQRLRDDMLCPQVGDVTLLQPWIWNQGNRRFLVSAIRFEAG